jgi:hypothetical protein
MTLLSQSKKGCSTQRQTGSESDKDHINIENTPSNISGLNRWTSITSHDRNLALTGTADEPFACDVCDRRFCFPGSLAFHHRDLHILGNRLKCAECDGRFVVRLDLRTHFRVVHLGVKSWRHDERGSRFATELNMNQHIRDQHSQETTVASTNAASFPNMAAAQLQAAGAREIENAEGRRSQGGCEKGDIPDASENHTPKKTADQRFACNLCNKTIV